MSAYIPMIEALDALAGGRVFPLVADEGCETPYIVLQRVGGAPMEFVSGDNPGKRLHRMQVSVWAATALEAEAVIGQVEDALRAAKALQTEVVTNPVDTYDELTTYRGSRQDFSVYC